MSDFKHIQKQYTNNKHGEPHNVPAYTKFRHVIICPERAKHGEIWVSNTSDLDFELVFATIVAEKGLRPVVHIPQLAEGLFLNAIFRLEKLT